MGYVAVKAGEEVIRRAEELFESRRVDGETDPLSVDQLDEQLSRVIDQVMSEAGLYAPRLAALAVKQAQGDTVEAAFLLRAYRSTLERWDGSVPTATNTMVATRRVSPAYKDVPGGQILGATKDYTQRLLDFGLLEDDGDDPTEAWELSEEEPQTLRNVMDILREEGLVAEADGSEETVAAGNAPEAEAEAETGKADDEPYDTTRQPVTFPLPRSGVLQELARGETGAVTALSYTALRGYGQVHPTLAEVRTGELPVVVEHPYTGDEVTVTTTRVTESEAVVPVYAKRDDPQFAFGYGLVYGRNERKAIGMTILDASIQLGGDEPAEDGEFVLDAIDGIDSFGFIEHLKLPHYVTFQSILDRIRAIRTNRGTADSSNAAETPEVSADD
ncbi:carbon-phosphorus lyase complex subunit PhnI [Natronorubrum aibiense]|uniref:Carbon-phosphorus lyase n=1 Tax=Natronorubrum aibiense TaxID=348826 RepID=A0A5P9P9P2_9EURY|nr:carbon-phosphorus lyase complex subunit PhnI [Natronorubrum aibiense]QFU84838.1 carbon-phosphorus lyase [Natronorubrum aibiense]